MKDNYNHVRLLYWGWGINILTYLPAHKHSFWQLEIIDDGEIETRLDGETRLLRNNFIYVIPPGNEHDFKKPSLKTGKVLSLKFETDGFPETLKAAIIPANDFSRHICSSLKNLLRKNIKDRTLSEDKKIALEYLIRDILEYCFVHKKTVSLNDSPIVIELYRMLNADGKKVNVEYAAKKLKCSSSFLKRHIKKEKGIPAKVFIDRECLRLIKQHLIYSHFQLTQIAEMMNFPDIYAFSRFFKRMSGMSPSRYRRLKQY
jgi:AraC family transcriptional activator of pobA